MNQLKHVKQIVYKLSRLYGVKAIWRRTLNSGDNAMIDPCTGQIDIQYDDINIRRIITLPVRQDRTFEYDLSYIAVAKNYTYGAYYDRDARQFILENKQIPLDGDSRPVPNQEDKILSDGVEYEIKQIDRIYGNIGYLIIGIAANNRDGDTYGT